MSYINKSFSIHPLVVSSRQDSPKRVQCHHTHVSCPVASVHLLADTVVGVFIRSASPCACHASVHSNGRHVTVSVAEGCRTIGADVTYGWDEQAGDVIVASGGRVPQWCVASGRTTVIRPSVRQTHSTPIATHTSTLSQPCNIYTKERSYPDRVLYNGVLPSAYVAYMLMSSCYSAATRGEV